MKQSRYTDLKQAESGSAITDLCRKHGMRSVAFYNCHLKKIYAEEKLKSEIAREAIEKKWSHYLDVERCYCVPIMITW